MCICELHFDMACGRDFSHLEKEDMNNNDVGVDFNLISQLQQ